MNSGAGCRRAIVGPPVITKRLRERTSTPGREDLHVDVVRLAVAVALVRLQAEEVVAGGLGAQALERDRRPRHRLEQRPPAMP